MDKHLKFAYLNDLYGGLLTEKQQKIMTMFYDEDLSVSEIASLENVSRQAVSDLLHRCEKILIAYDEKLLLFDKYMKNIELIEDIELSIKENEYLLGKIKALKDNL